MYSDKEQVNILTSLLVASGIRHAVVCPGSRNAPIAPAPLLELSRSAWACPLTAPQVMHLLTAGAPGWRPVVLTSLPSFLSPSFRQSPARPEATTAAQTHADNHCPDTPESCAYQHHRPLAAPCPATPRY